MGRYNFRASRVQRAATALLNAKRTSVPPRWYAAVSDIPPPEVMVRPLPTQHTYDPPESTESQQQAASEASFAAYPNPSSYAPDVDPAPRSIFDRPTRNAMRNRRKPKKIFMPRPITYQEDDLRTDFFTDHPWELARPRSMLELTGNDHRHWDWSKPHQPGRPVNGESVIQRQLHLMRTDPAHTKASAYDQARKELYAHRHHEQVERRIAREEADAVGATGWGKTANEVGMLLEGRTFEQWRVWAEGRAVEIEQGRMSSTGGGAEGNRARPEVPDPIEAEEQAGQEQSNPANPESATAMESAAAELSGNVPGTKQGQVAQGGAMFRP